MDVGAVFIYLFDRYFLFLLLGGTVLDTGNMAVNRNSA